MTNKEIAQTFIDAYEEGYVADLETSSCNSSCDECPAEQSCLTLSEKGSYETFKANYDEKILPIIKEMTE